MGFKLGFSNVKNGSAPSASGTARVLLLVVVFFLSLSLGCSRKPKPASSLPTSSSNDATNVTPPAPTNTSVTSTATSTVDTAATTLISTTTDIVSGTVPIVTEPPVTRVAAGGNHTCAAPSTGGVKCWGVNGSGQLGDGSFSSFSTLPVAVSGIAATSISAIAAGGNHTCVILKDGEINCWGSNLYGQLGNAGKTVTSNLPVEVLGLPAVRAIAAGIRHTCAVLVEGSAFCWGSNFLGELGNGTTTLSAVPVKVLQISAARAIAAGTTHTCALLTEGGVYCWGSNYHGELGNGTTTESPLPVLVSEITTGVAIASGYSHTCVLQKSGKIKCWGSNVHGELGNGQYGASSNIPVTVSGITTAVFLAAGGAHTCAILDDGSIKCWGANANGELGNGTRIDASTPEPVFGIVDSLSISAGVNHTCATLSDHGVRCWGPNDYGQLGNGTLTDSTTPVNVMGIP